MCRLGPLSATEAPVALTNQIRPNHKHAHTAVTIIVLKLYFFNSSVPDLPFFTKKYLLVFHHRGKDSHISQMIKIKLLDYSGLPQGFQEKIPGHFQEQIQIF